MNTENDLERTNQVYNMSSLDYGHVATNNTSLPSKKRHKIRSKKSFEHQIEEEKQNLINNAVVLGVASIGTVIAFASIGIDSLEISQRIGGFCLGLAGTRGIKESYEALVRSIAQKTKLERLYDFHYGENEMSKEGGRSR